MLCNAVISILVARIRTSDHVKSFYGFVVKILCDHL